MMRVIRGNRIKDRPRRNPDVTTRPPATAPAHRAWSRARRSRAVKGAHAGSCLHRPRPAVIAIAGRVRGSRRSAFIARSLDAATALICPAGKISSMTSRSRAPIGLCKLKIRCAKNAIYRADFKLIWVVQSCAEKFSAFLTPQINIILSAIPCSQGAYRDRHGRWVRDAMDAVVTQDERHQSGRRSRVVLAPRRWRQATPYRCNDGGKRARSPGRARRKPLKPLRREGWAIPANLW